MPRPGATLTPEEFKTLNEAARAIRWFESRPDHPRAYAELLVERHWQLVERLVWDGYTDGGNLRDE